MDGRIRFFPLWMSLSGLSGLGIRMQTAYGLICSNLNIFEWFEWFGHQNANGIWFDLFHFECRTKLWKLFWKLVQPGFLHTETGGIWSSRTNTNRIQIQIVKRKNEECCPPRFSAHTNYGSEIEGIWSRGANTNKIQIQMPITNKYTNTLNLVKRCGESGARHDVCQKFYTAIFLG